MKHNKSRLVIAAILAVCLLGTAVLLLVSRDQQRLLRQLQAEAQLLVVTPDGEAVTLGYEQIRALPATEFTATIRASGKAPEDAVYIGVAFAELLAAAGLDEEDIAGCSRMVVTAADGYVVSFRMGDVLAEENLYLVYMQDGELMRPLEQGGLGPYQLIARQDSFSQRWAKYVAEIKFDRE